MGGGSLLASRARSSLSLSLAVLSFSWNCLRSSFRSLLVSVPVVPSFSIAARSSSTAGVSLGGGGAQADSASSVASGPARVTAGLVVLYDFAAGGGNIVPDVSGVGASLDLTIADPGAVTWLPGGGGQMAPA